MVVDSAAFGPRCEYSGLVFDNKMWVLGGISQYEVGDPSYSEDPCVNDVWNSIDGKTWTQITASAPWSKRRLFSALSFNNKMWIMGGLSGLPNPSALNEVWSSSDGKTWTKETDHAGWSERYGHSAVVFDNKMWVLGGTNANDNFRLYNDIWCSSDGKNWIKSTTATGWVPRTDFGALAWGDKLWIAGGTNGWRTEANDVWYLKNETVLGVQKGQLMASNVIMNNLNINQSSGTVNIRFQLTRTATVRIDIYNSSGKKIVKICDDVYTSGEHSIIWNRLMPGNAIIPHGIYLISFKSGELRTTHSLILN